MGVDGVGRAGKKGDDSSRAQGDCLIAARISRERRGGIGNNVESSVGSKATLQSEGTENKHRTHSASTTWLLVDVRKGS